MPILTNSQGALVAGCTPNDTIAISVTSGAYSLEYPLGTVLASGSTVSASYNLGAGQFRLTTTGNVTYTVTANPDTGNSLVSYDASSGQLYAGSSLVSGGGNPALPAPPTSVLAQATNSGATVQWQSNHPLPTSWLVTASPGGAQVQVNATSVLGSATFSGLTNGQAYTFSVQAVSSVGAGRASAPSNSVTPTALPSTVLPVTRGLEFWWSAGQVTGVSNGAALANLTDFSGNGYNFAGNNGGGTWVSSWSGGKPALALNGSSQYYDALASGYFAGMRGPAMTVYALHDVQGQPASIGYVLAAHRPDPLAGLLTRCFGLGVKLGAAGNSDEIVLDNMPDYANAASASVVGSDIPWGTPIRATVTAPGKLRVNGSAVSGIINPRLYAGSGAQPWTAGCMYGGGFNYYLQGRIAELVIFSAVHTPAEIALMEAYLATRF